MDVVGLGESEVGGVDGEGKGRGAIGEGEHMGLIEGLGGHGVQYDKGSVWVELEVHSFVLSVEACWVVGEVGEEQKGWLEVFVFCGEGCLGRVGEGVGVFEVEDLGYGSGDG